MSRHLVIEGREELKDMLLDVLPNEVRNAARAATYAIAVEVVNELKHAIKKRSRKGEESIKAYRRNSPPDAPVSEARGGRGAPYLLMLNFGTSRTKAQPFIEPTVEAKRPTLAATYREQVGRKLEQAARRKAKRLR